MIDSALRLQALLSSLAHAYEKQDPAARLRVAAESSQPVRLTDGDAFAPIQTSWDTDRDALSSESPQETETANNDATCERHSAQTTAKGQAHAL